MNIPVIVLLVFAAWTLLTLFASVGVYRWSRILTGRTPIGEWRADLPQGSDWYKRAPCRELAYLHSNRGSARCHRREERDHRHTCHRASCRAHRTDASTAGRKFALPLPQTLKRTSGRKLY